MKAIKTVAIAGAGVVAAALSLTAFIRIPANFLVGALQARVEADTGYQLQIDGATKLGLWPAPTVFARDIELLHGKESDSQRQFKAESVRIVLSFAGLLSGHLQITELTMSRPSLRLPVSRERTPVRAATPATVADAGAPKDFPAIDRIRIEDGSVGLYSGPSHLETSIDRVNLDAVLSSTDGASVTGKLYWGGQMVHVELKSQLRPQRLGGQTIPVDFILRFPGLSEWPLFANAELKARNASLAINALSGRFGHSRFNGWATLDLSETKPLVKGDVNFDELQIPIASDTSNSPQRHAVNKPWSDQEFNFDGLNFFDADVRVSADAFEFKSLRFMPIALQITISRGVLQGKLMHAGLYGGEANGTISLDTSGSGPADAMQIRLEAVNVLPLLSDVAGFGNLEGTMHANIDVNATGASEQAVISTVAGGMEFQLSNGAVRGIDMAKLMRNLTADIVSRWQQNAADKAELGDVNARVRFSNGIAHIDKFEMAGPIVHVTATGNVDLLAKSLQLKVDPWFIAGTIGLGVPIMVQGSWSEPRIYPDVAGILDDPEGVYGKLKAAGKGFFGDTDHASKNGPPLNSLVEGIGKMLNAPAGNRSALPGNDQ
jgi:AsmA protein